MKHVVLDEMFDKRIKNVEYKTGKKRNVEFTFTLEPKDMINPNEVPINYKVYFSPPIKINITCGIGPGMIILSSTLMFNNDRSNMSTLVSRGFQSVNQNIVFSTIIAIVLRYFETKKKVQGINFTASHDGLHKAYKILAKEAEKKGDLMWANPSSSPNIYNIVRKDIWNKYKSMIK